MIGQPIDKKVEGVGRFVAIVTLSVQPAESEEGRGSTAPKDDARDSERVLRVHARHKPHTRRLWQKTNRIKKRAATDHGDREGLRCCNRGNHIQSVTVKKTNRKLKHPCAEIQTTGHKRRNCTDTHTYSRWRRGRGSFKWWVVMGAGLQAYFTLSAGREAFGIF